VFLKIGFGIVTIVTGNDGRNQNLRMNELAVTAFATRNMAETGFAQVVDEVSDLPRHTLEYAQGQVFCKLEMPNRRLFMDPFFQTTV